MSEDIFFDCDKPVFIWNEKLNEYWCFTPNYHYIKVLVHDNCKAIIHVTYTSKVEFVQMIYGMLKLNHVKVITLELFFGVYFAINSKLVPANYIDSEEEIKELIEQEQLKFLLKLNDEHKRNDTGHKQPLL